MEILISKPLQPSRERRDSTSLLTEDLRWQESITNCLRATHSFISNQLGPLTITFNCKVSTRKYGGNLLNLQQIQLKHPLEEVEACLTIKVQIT